MKAIFEIFISYTVMLFIKYYNNLQIVAQVVTFLICEITMPFVQ